MFVTNCISTWDVTGYRDEAPLALAVTEADCPRLPAHLGVTVPLVRGGRELSQIFLDLRTAHAIEWNQVVLIYDSSIGNENFMH